MVCERGCVVVGVCEEGGCVVCERGWVCVFVREGGCV